MNESGRPADPFTTRLAGPAPERQISRDLVKRGDISANVEMRPGDILIIPQSWF